MAFIPGGTFQIGRDDVAEDRAEYSAHPEVVDSFYLDKTEVTNAEYGEFVRATGHRVPRNEETGDKEAPATGGESYWKPWKDRNPPAGRELWPVRNVSVKDAEEFAKWRSKDGLKCRLPQEKEWEYAARSADSSNFYPWGTRWINGYANLDSALPKSVGSYAKGASSAGVLDLIGNVWEWTSSKASYYNNSTVPDDERDHFVIRGGAYGNSARGADAISAASRNWLPADSKDPTVGFRLVCDKP